MKRTRAGAAARWPGVLWLCALASVMALNVVAWWQARSMLVYVTGGERTARPESLSPLRKAWVLVRGVRLPRPENYRTPAALGLPFTVERVATSDGMELESWVVPADPERGWVVLLHGYGTAKAWLVDEAEAFFRLGYSVMLLDFRGSGGSHGAETTLGYREAEDAAAAVHWLRTRKRVDAPLLLYGQSMGGAAALRAVAVLGARVDGVMLESVFDTLLNAARNRFRAMGLPSWPLAELLVFWGGRRAGCSGFRLNPAEWAAGVSCPVLLLHGARDPRVTRAQVDRLYKRFPGRRALEIFPDAAHATCLADDPERWREAVRAFLEAVEERVAVPSL